MLKYNAKVIEVKNNMAVVKLNCFDSCDGCKGCEFRENKIEVENFVDAKVGDSVELEILNFSSKLTVLCCYILPIVFALVLTLSLMNFVSQITLCFVSLICFIFFLSCGIIVSKKLTKKLKLRIVKKGE